MSQKNFLPVLHKHGAHPQSIHLASTAMSKNPVVPIVGVNVSMCVCVGWGVKEQRLYLNPIQICLSERQVQSHTHGKNSILRN